MLGNLHCSRASSMAETCGPESTWWVHVGWHRRRSWAAKLRFELPPTIRMWSVKQGPHCSCCLHSVTLMLSSCSVAMVLVSSSSCTDWLSLFCGVWCVSTGSLEGQRECVRPLQAMLCHAVDNYLSIVMSSSSRRCICLREKKASNNNNKKSELVYSLSPAYYYSSMALIFSVTPSSCLCCDHQIRCSFRFYYVMVAAVILKDCNDMGSDLRVNEWGPTWHLKCRSHLEVNAPLMLMDHWVEACS